jgi:hypothetical protein
MSFVWKCLCEEHELDKETTSARKANLVLLMKKYQSIFSKYYSRLLTSHSTDFKLSLQTGHVFYKSNANCKCGLFTRTKNDPHYFFDLGFEDLCFVINNSRVLLSFNELLDKDNEMSLIKNVENVKLIDCCESKINALKVARDILSTVMHIGVFVYN